MKPPEARRLARMNVETSTFVNNSQDRLTFLWQPFADKAPRLYPDPVHLCNLPLLSR